MRRARKGKGRSAGRPPPRPEALHYKVVELSTVDEGSLEHTVNVWVRQGWRLENVQFVADLTQHRRELDAEGIADRREQFRRRFLLAALDFGEVAEGHPRAG